MKISIAVVENVSLITVERKDLVYMEWKFNLSFRKKGAKCRSTAL